MLDLRAPAFLACSSATDNRSSGSGRPARSSAWNRTSSAIASASWSPACSSTGTASSIVARASARAARPRRPTSSASAVASRRPRGEPCVAELGRRRHAPRRAPRGRRRGSPRQASASPSLGRSSDALGRVARQELVRPLRAATTPPASRPGRRRRGPRGAGAPPLGLRAGRRPRRALPTRAARAGPGRGGSPAETSPSMPRSIARAGQALVQLGAPPLRHAGVGDVADERVPERPAPARRDRRPRRGGRALAGRASPARRPRRRPTSAATSSDVNDVPHTAAAWTTARSRSSSRSRRAASSVWIESGSVSELALERGGEQLLDEERIALRDGSRMRLARRGVEPSVARQSRSSSVSDSARRQRVEQDRRAAQAPAAPVRPDVEQVGTREAEHQHGSAGELDERLDEVEERGCGPVHVLEDEQQRALQREAGEQPAGRERRVLGVRGSGCEPDGDRELVGEVRRRRSVPSRRGATRRGRRRRARSAGRGAARTWRPARRRGSGRRPRSPGLAKALDALDREARLAQPRRAEDGDEVRDGRRRPRARTPRRSRRALGRAPRAASRAGGAAARRRHRPRRSPTRLPRRGRRPRAGRPARFAAAASTSPASARSWSRAASSTGAPDDERVAGHDLARSRGRRGRRGRTSGAPRPP